MPEGATLLADKGYDSNAIRAAAAARKAWANIPSRSNRRQRFAFSGWLYRQRNLVERFFNRIKHFRGIATLYDKCAIVAENARRQQLHLGQGQRFHLHLPRSSCESRYSP